MQFAVYVETMSYFGTQLDELLKRKNMKAVDLARLSGVGEPMISRYRKGDQVWVDPGDLSRLAVALSNDPKEQAELLRARLLDECQGPGSNLINIDIAGTANLREPAAAYGIKLPADLEAHFRVLREWVIRDQDLREVIEGLGNMLAKKPVETEPSPASPVNSSGVVEKLIIRDVQKLARGEDPPKGRRSK